MLEASLAEPWGDHWVDYLDQGQLWRDRHGREIRLDDMDREHCANVRAFLLRRADAIVDHLTHEILCTPPPTGWQASIDYEGGVSRFMTESQDPGAWLIEQELLIALDRRAKGLPAAGPSVCHCGYEATFEWDHSACYPGIIVD